MTQRLLATFVLLLAIIFLPYWIYAPLLFLALLYFPFYIEGLLLAFGIDLLYNPVASENLSSFPFAIGAFLILLVSLVIRDKLRLHA